MECNDTLCRHNGVTEKVCCCKNPETFCKYLEATEIIREFLHNRKTPYLEGELDLFEKAEAFLKE